MTPEQRNEEVSRLETRRREIVADMLQEPFDERHKDRGREGELELIEERLLNLPPLIQTQGEWAPAGHGLVEPTPADFALLDAVGKPMSLEEAGIRVIPESEWSGYINGLGGEQVVFADRYVPGITNQGSVGSCAADAIAGCGMTLRETAGQRNTPTLNGYYLYSRTSGGVDRGSTLQANLALMLQEGCCSERVRPRSRGWRAVPTDAERRDAAKYRLQRYVQVRNWAEFGTMLLLNRPVYFGYIGHAIYASRLLSTTQLVYVNSWGANWGQSGRGTLSCNSIYWIYGVYALTAMVHDT